MPFSSAGGRRPAIAGSESAVLPTTVRRRSQTHRRRWGGAASSSVFYAVGLAISFLLFVVVALRLGVPNPKPAPRLTRQPAFRRPATASFSAGNFTAGVGDAPVDLTTRELYDKIEFLDLDGGAWKQGWEVKYRGDEWDNEKLKVFVVPHSHNDPGWKLTVEEYYERKSRRILDAIVKALSKDVRRKFIWEEMSYLERWWRDASTSKKKDFVQLVKNGQLEIVGGGWVMNDEVPVLPPNTVVNYNSYTII